MILKNKECVVNEYVCVSVCVCMYWLTEKEGVMDLFSQITRELGF